MMYEKLNINKKHSAVTESEQVLPENRELFMKMAEKLPIVKLCGLVTKNKFKELYEDAYNFDDQVREFGKETYGELFADIDEDLKE